MANRRSPVGRFRSILLLLGFWVGFGTSLLAQDASPWIRLQVVDVKPSMLDEFMTVQKELSGLAKKAEVPWMDVSQTASFGKANRFLIVTPLQNLASLDREERATPETTSRKYRLQKCLESEHTYGVLYLPEMSNPLPADKEPSLMIINIARIAPGREQDYLSVMKSDFFPHFDEDEAYYVSGSLTFGGSGGFIHTFYVDDFASLDEGSPVVRALGAEGAQAVTAKLSGIVTSSELWTMRLVPELSFRPAKTETEQR